MAPSNFGLHKLLQDAKVANKPVVGMQYHVSRFIVRYVILTVASSVNIAGSWLMLPGASLARMIAQMKFDVSLFYQGVRDLHPDSS